MLFIVGVVTVVVCVFGGYVALGGKMYVLWQPFELVIIGGAAIGAFIIGNPKNVLINTCKALGKLLKGSPYNKESYLELLTMQYAIFKLAKSKGMLALEAHVEDPHDSDLFKQFPIFQKNHHALEFLCDYLRMMILGSENPFEMESLMDEEIDTRHSEELQISTAIQSLADATPALGIVAAVLGIIKTMGATPNRPKFSADSSAAPWWEPSSACFWPTACSVPWRLF